MSGVVKHAIIRIMTDFNFELPDVEGKSEKPRVHISGDVCVSCEG